MTDLSLTESIMELQNAIESIDKAIVKAGNDTLIQAGDKWSLDDARRSIVAMRRRLISVRDLKNKVNIP